MAGGTITVGLPSDVVEGITFIIVDIALRALVGKTISTFTEVQHSTEIKKSGKVKLSTARMNLFVDRPTTKRGKLVQTIAKVITLAAVTAVSFTTLGRTQDSRETADVVKSVSRQNVIDYDTLINKQIEGDFQTFDNEVLWVRLISDCKSVTFNGTLYQDVVCSTEECMQIFLEPNTFKGDEYEAERQRLKQQAECGVDIEDPTVFDPTFDLHLRGESGFRFGNDPDGWTIKLEKTSNGVSLTVYAQMLSENEFEIECNVVRKKTDGINSMVMRCIGIKHDDEEGTTDIFMYVGSRGELSDEEIDDTYPWDNAEGVNLFTRINTVSADRLQMIKDSILAYGMPIDLAVHYSKYEPARATVSIRTGSSNVTDLQLWSLIMFGVVCCLWLIMLAAYTREKRKGEPVSALATWSQWMGTVGNASGTADCRHLRAERLIYGKKKHYKHLGPLAADELVGTYDLMETKPWGERREDFVSGDVSSA